MEWPTIPATEALIRLKRGACAVDVRSRSEFDKGHIPRFTNVAILNDDHRHQVGLTYKQRGQSAAVDLGMQLVTPFKPRLLTSWKKALAHEMPQMRILICWRGGLRSRISADWLKDDGVEGVRVAGGYKEMRARLIETLDKPPEFVVIGGLTGCGKTDLLRSLSPDSVLDLEFHANHRGSSFGLDIESIQPTQQTFENALGLTLFECKPILAVEAESRLIGRCSIPGAVKSAMDRSPIVILDSSMDDRIARIFSEYVEQPLNKFSRALVLAHLLAALQRVERRLGGVRYQQIQRQLNGAFSRLEVKVDSHAPWIESLLREYYDPQYEYAFKSKERPVAFRGDFQSLKAYLDDRLND